MDWNAIALEAVKNDAGFSSPDQGGPTRIANALAVVHVAMFDAVNAINGAHTAFEYQGMGVRDASVDAAVATAAYATLIEVFPQQKADFDAAYADYLAEIPDGLAEDRGVSIGNAAAGACLAARADDGSDTDPPYEFNPAIGHHQLDPQHPLQGVLTPGWGQVKPFAMTSGDQFRAPAPPELTSEEYAAAFNEVRVLGAIDAETADRDGNGLPDRTPEQTEIGIFWGYDGAKGIGTPPRLYNQIARVIAEQQGNTVEENARMFALFNVAMADAGIASWETKYVYDFWRPVVAIRSGALDGNADTPAELDWTPLGAPASNSGDPNGDFTPPFPAYVSGHSTFGAAAFRILERFYGTDDIAFSFQSDEFNGVTQDARGVVRPAVTRHFDSFSQAAQENAISRIYLGVHWSFDATEGMTQGNAVADYVFDNMFREQAPLDDPVLDWNWIALEAVKNDHGLASPDQGGPTKGANALAIVHAAIYDAVNAIEGSHAPYAYNERGARTARLDAAVAAAAHAALVDQFPQQEATFDAALAAYLAAIPDGPAETEGASIGVEAAASMLAARENDGTDADMTYELTPGPGHHQVDPMHPDQGFLTPKWGLVRPFGIESGSQFRAPAPPALDSAEYAAAYQEVMVLGADDAETADRNGDGQPDRTREQTEIGLFWAYDGSKDLGVPPRLYNQIARTIAIQKGNTVVENARLFALLNMAQADAGIASWESKYVHDFWRPVVAIRAGATDGNEATIADPNWAPLGAPASNSDDPQGNFTPPFPAYVSGHATFGAAAFRILERFYGTDEIAFGFLSDEMDGVTRGADGQVRQPVYRTFARLSDAVEENARSRIYLGIHWIFDATEGIAQGTRVADYVFDHELLPLANPSPLGTMLHNERQPLDANGDGRLDVSDLQTQVEQLRYFLSNGELDPQFRGFCDVTGDRILSLADLLPVVNKLRERLEGGDNLPETPRPIDGTGVNGDHPDWGAAGVELLDIVGFDYADGMSEMSGHDRPSPREISNVVMDQRESIVNDRQLSDMVWQWGQFVDHDLDLTPETDPAELAPIVAPQGDSFFDPFNLGGQTIGFNRSKYNPETGASPESPRRQMNVLTAYLDGSNIYGSDAERAAALRTFADGKLKTSDGDLLPFNDAGLPNANPLHLPSLFLAGDERANEQVGLTAMHTLWVREHNRLADEVALAHPDWNDEQIYQKARSIVIALLQRITYHEFLPALLGANPLREYAGYDDTVNAGISSLFSAAAYRVGHTLLSPQLLRLDNNGEPIPAGPLSLRAAFFAPQEVIDHGIESVLHGLTSQLAQEIDVKIIDDVRNFLFGPPGAGGFDLASLNIQRGRDHGLPDYNRVREALGLARANTFADISSDPDVQAALELAYGDVDKIDVWVGALAEDHRPGSSVGELIHVVLADQFQRVRDADPYWYTRILTPEEIAQVESTTLSDVIARNTGITNLQENVFFVA